MGSEMCIRDSRYGDNVVDFFVYEQNPPEELAEGPDTGEDRESPW